MLDDIKQTYIKYADNIPGWKTMDKSKLANLYLEHEHVEPERSYYFSALMCRYWKNVFKFYKASQGTRLELSDFTSWLAESFFIAFKYRRWKDPKSKLYNDPQAPDKVINRCIYSTRLRYYQYYNMDKRKINFQTDSIDRQLESFGHLASVYKYLGTTDPYVEDDRCKTIINHYLSEKNIFNAIILDLICFSDTFRNIKSVSNAEIENIDDETDIEMFEEFSEKLDDIDTLDENVDFEEFDEEQELEPKILTKITYTQEFSLRKLLIELRKIDESYINYFCSVYEINRSELKSTLVQIKDLDSRKTLSRVVNKIIKNISKDKKVGDILLCS